MQTIIRCRPKVARGMLIGLSIMFLLLGCTSMLRRVGMSDEQAEEQAAQMKTAIADAAGDAVETIKTGIAEGQDLKTVVVKAGSEFAWQMATLIVSGIGVVLSGLLAKWLKTEKKINTAMITGVEKADKSEVKTAIQREATAAGVEAKLHARVLANTGS